MPSISLKVGVLVYGIAFSLPFSAFAVEYFCTVNKKYDSEYIYSKEQILKGKYSLKIKESNGKAFVARCSDSIIEKKFTCDWYKIDRIEFTKNVNIKKYYYFSGQFDFQLFSNLAFVENNGRGGIAYGKCELVSP